MTAAENEGFDLLLTTDRNLRYQQKLAGRRIAILVLSTTSWPRIERSAASVSHAVDSTKPGTYTEIDVP